MIQLELKRRRAKLSQAALGRETGVNQTTISAIEHGRINPSDSELFRLAEGLGFAGDPASLTDEVQVS